MRAPFRSALLPVILAPAVLLSACGSGGEDAEAIDGMDDPALSGALEDQIMVDPDLTGQNEVATGASMTSTDGSLPSENNSLEEIAAARAAALKFVGGPGKMLKAPAPQVIDEKIPEAARVSLAARATASATTGASCADKVSYSMAWAAKLPAAIPIYPRANVQEAAGTDDAGCSLRVVNFTTPVALSEVVDFYYSAGRNAGFDIDRYQQDSDDILGGARGEKSFIIYARRVPSGRTDVDLITSD